MSSDEVARVLRIIGKYAWAAADEIDAKPDAEKPETAVDIETARKEAAARRKRLGGNTP